MRYTHPMNHLLLLLPVATACQSSILLGPRDNPYSGCAGQWIASAAPAFTDTPDAQNPIAVQLSEGVLGSTAVLDASFADTSEWMWWEPSSGPCSTDTWMATPHAPATLTLDERNLTLEGELTLYLSTSGTERARHLEFGGDGPVSGDLAIELTALGQAHDVPGPVTSVSVGLFVSDPTVDGCDEFFDCRYHVGLRTDNSSTEVETGTANF